MLDKTSRKFLKFISKNAPNLNGKYFTFDYVGEKLGMSSYETFDCIRFLDDEGLIMCIWENPDRQQGLHGFAINHRGRHRLEFATMELFKSILESVLLPILVSVLTTLILAA